MRTRHLLHNGFLVPRVAAALFLVSAAGFLTFYSFAADPPSGTLNAANPKLTYMTGPNVQSNPSGFAGTLQCNPAAVCDDFDLTVDATGFVGTHNILITVVWPNNTEDYDLYVHQGQNPPGTVLRTSASSADPEIAVIDAVSGLYTVRVVPFAVAGGTFTATIEFVPKPASTTPLPPGPGTPRYHNFAAPGAMGNSSGEPTLAPGKQSLGGRTMFLAGTETLRLTWNDCSSPASGPGFPGLPEKFLPLWEDKSFATTSGPSLDPILFGDFVTGRTFVSQLGPKTSFLAFTDNDGGEDADTSNDYTPSQGSGINSGVDHQTLGGGPYKADSNPPPPPHPLYENAVYYASQDSAVAQMARSDTGGATFGAAVPMYNLTQCGGLHGHTKVTPANAATLANGHAGTLYVPNKSCGTTQGVVVSEDNGVTFQIRNIPGSLPGDTDPSIGIDAAGTIYFAFADGDGRSKVAVSSNKGVNWSIPVDVGLPFGIRNTVFAGAVGGDAGRATVMYLATDTPGAYQQTGVFPGVWHIYASSTFDGGANWTTVRVSPENDPVQRGSICTGGLGCMGGDRNLLDFNDVEIDHEGRVIIAYADGCVGCTSPTGADSRAAKATIARQSGGKRMIAAFDPNPPEPVVPASPRVNGVSEVLPGKVRIAWSEPDNGGSPLTGYNVYRRTHPGVYGAPLATVTLGCPACKTTYDDTTAIPGTTYFYKVTALNDFNGDTFPNEGSSCGEFAIGAVVVEEDHCVAPGITVATDPAGDQLAAQAGETPNSKLDVQLLKISEAYTSASDHSVTFTLKVDNLTAPLPPQATWFIRFNALDTTNVSRELFVEMDTNGTDPTIPEFHIGRNDEISGNSLDSGQSQLDGLLQGAFTADGTITIRLTTETPMAMTATGAPNFTVTLGPGSVLSNVSISTAQLVGAAGTGLNVFTDQDTNNGGVRAYRLSGNQVCRPNTAPIPGLTANPLTGPEPLLVNFDASASSDPDTDPPADTIASATFNFGDGTAEVTCPGGTGCTGVFMVSHTYAEDGNYQAGVRVTDSRGKPSDSVATVVIQVTSTGGTPTPTPSPTPDGTATPTPTPTATATPSATPSATPTPTATPSGTPQPCGTPVTYSNPGLITIQDAAAATPYPSNITVFVEPGTVSNATVTLKSVTHNFPDDIGVLLVGPTGVKVRLMTDVGGGSLAGPPDPLSLDNVTFSFDDAAPAPVPDEGPIVAASYQPTEGLVSNLSGPHPPNFPAPAPASPYGNVLSSFNGTDANGTWSLFVDDDTAVDGGSIENGWSVTITTVCGGATPTPTPTATPSATPDPTATPSATPAPTATPSATPAPTATPTPTPVATPGASPTPTPVTTPTPAPTATPTATPAASPTPTPTPTATPAQLLNISTRARVLTGDKILIGGFIIQGNAHKRVILLAKGPSLNVSGTPIPGRLANPTLELHDGNGALMTSNDDWKDSPERTQIESSGFAPSEDEESAILRTLAPGVYTGVLAGKDNSTGIALIEVYDLDADVDSLLANISSRGNVDSGDNVMIGGFIAGNEDGNTKVFLRGIGPSLQGKVPDPLGDPFLELHNANGALLEGNDNWEDSPNRAEIEATGIPPNHDLESAIIRSVAPGNYTAILRGNTGTGIALVEIYNIR